MSIKLSVIVPTFNGSGILDETFGALAAQQTSFEWEMVCADNGSTDDTLLRLETWASRMPALRVTDASDRRGVGHARNRAVEASRGYLLVYIDQDDVPRPGYLQAMADALTRDPLVGARMDGETLNPGARSHVRQTDSIPIAFDRFPGASGGSMGMRRSLYDQLGGFDTSVGVSDDIDFCWRAQLHGHTIGFVPEAVLMYRFRTNLRSLYRQGTRYGEALSLMRRRYELLLPPVDSPGSGGHGPASILLRVVTARSGSVREAATALGWYRGILRGRKIPIDPLSPQGFSHLP